MTHASKRFALASAVLLLLLPLVSLAAEFRASEQPSLSSDETIVGDLYMAGGNITANGPVRGDLISAGGTILVSGAVSGDVLTAGGSITILGTVSDDVRAGGGNIVVQGRVGGDVVIGGGQVNIGGPGVGGDVAVGGGVVRIEAPVQGKILIGAGDVYINSSVGGDVTIEADKVTLGPKAVIAGDLTYSAGETATMEEGAVVRGETKFTERPDVKGAAQASLAALLSLWFIGKFFMTLAAALAIGLIFRKFAATLVKTATDEPLFEIGRGVVFLIVTPVASVILLITFIGIPLGVLGLLAFATTMLFVSLAAPIILGSVVHKWLFKPSEYQVSWKTILLGVALCALLTLVPIVGWLAKFILMLLTLGAVMNIKWEALKGWR